MKDFFTYKGGIGFRFGNATHITTLILFALAIIVLYINKDKLSKWKNKDKMRYVIAGILFTNMTVYYVSLMLNGIYDWKHDLPFHLCFITGYFFIYVMVTGNKKLYKLVYFFTFIGPLPAIIIPDTTQNLGRELGPDRYIYYQYVISHHFLVLSSLYTLWVLKYEISVKDILPAFIYGNLLVGGMTIFNYFMGTNYIMVFDLPPHVVKYFPFVKFGTPIMWLEMVGMAALTISYLPVYISKKNEIKLKEA